jgi:phospholipid transport system transporter-binding protein
MIANEAGRLVISVPMVMDNARGLLDTGRQLLEPGTQVFDFSQVGVADSSAVAVMLGWLRAADQLRSTLTFAEVPPGVRSLAELYGVTDLLPLA